MQNSKNNNLPMLGVGPYYGIFSFALTILSFLYFNDIQIFQLGIINNLFIKKCFSFISILFMLIGISLWCYVVLPSKGIRYKIEHGELATDGAYSLTRNPIYSAIFIFLIGVQMRTYNLFIFIVSLIIYIFLDVLIIKTEEQWCLDKFGKAYEEYCKRVNRIIPWFPKKIQKNN